MSISKKRVEEINLFCKYLTYMEDPAFSVNEIPEFATDGDDVFIRCKRAKKYYFVPAREESDWGNFRYGYARKSFLIALAEFIRNGEDSFGERVWELLSDFVKEETLIKLKTHEYDIRKGIEFEEYTFEDSRKRMLARIHARGRDANLLVVFENQYYVDAYNVAMGLRSEICRRYRKYNENGRKFLVFDGEYRIYEENWTYETGEEDVK